MEAAMPDWCGILSKKRCGKLEKVIECKVIEYKAIECKVIEGITQKEHHTDE